MKDIVISIEQLRDTIVDAIDLAMEKFEISHSPESGLVKRSQAVRFIKRNNLKPSILDIAERRGIIHRAKPQTGKGYTIWYKFSDIKELVASAKLVQRIYGGEIKKDADIQDGNQG